MKRTALIASLLLILAGQVSARDLDIYFIDVEGGQATLIVTPAGETLLIDAGYGGTRGSRDPDRILAAARAAKVDRIDFLLITHFHPDHAGGVPELASRIPIGTFVDYGTPMGTDRMALGVFRAYEPVRGRHEHIRPSPGDRLPLEGLDVDVDDVIAATDHVVPALEIIDARTQAPRPLFDAVADNAGLGAVVLGDARTNPADIDLPWIGAALIRNDMIEETGVSAAVLGHPAIGVSWLARALYRFGMRLEAGQLMLSGSFIRPVAVTRGDRFRAEFGRWDSVTVTFA